MRRLALVGAALVLLSSCKLSIAVGVDAHADGSGLVTATVTLDKEAAARLQRAGGRLEADDLRNAGWKVSDKKTLSNGSEQVTATKPFASAGELDAVIAEVAGDRKPLRDFKLTRTRSFARTDTKFSGTVDLTGGINAFGDDRLRKQTGADVGLDQAAIERQAGVTLNKFFDVQVAVRLPGSVSSNAPSNAGNGAVWRPKLGQKAVLRAAANQVDTRRIIYVAVAVVAGVAFVVIVTGRVRQSRRRDVRPRAPRI